LRNVYSDLPQRMDAIVPHMARKLLTRDFANLAQRVQLGGNVNRSERAMLEGMAASVGHAPSVAGNDVKLANVLGVTRRTLHPMVVGSNPTGRAPLLSLGQATFNNEQQSP